MRANKANSLKLVTTRLFAADIITLRQLAEARGSKWQIELRQLVRRALKGEQREIVVLKESR